MSLRVSGVSLVRLSAALYGAGLLCCSPLAHAATPTELSSAASTTAPPAATDAPPVTPAKSQDGRVSKTRADQVVELDAVQVVGRARKEQHPQRPATAISRVRGESLSELHVDDIQDLQYVVPGLYIQSTDSNDTQLTLRGIGDGGGQTSGDQNIGMPSSVATYVDNVYYPRPGIIRSLTDIDYIDVFKGPNGTVFGQNATGGAVDIHTRPPVFGSSEARVSLSYGQRDTSKASAVLSAPINDVAAYRLSTAYAHSDGSVRNLADGERLNGYDRRGLRGQLLLRPAADWEIKLSADYGRESATPTRVFKSLGNSFLNTAKAIGATAVAGDRETVVDDVTRNTSEQGGVSAEINHRLANGYKLRSVSALRHYHFSPQYADELSVHIYANSGTAVDDSTLSQDLRLESPRGEFFDYLVGLSYFRDLQDTEAHTRYANTALVTTYAGSSYRGLDIIRYGRLRDDMSSAYGRGSFHLSDRLDLQLGARATYSERHASFVRLNRASFDSGQLSLYKVLPSLTASLKFQLTDDWSSYLSYGSGQKAGGINVSAGAAKKAGYDTLVLKPETTRNVELGIQGVLLDGRLSVQADVFRSRVTDFQTQAYDELNATSYLMNAGSYRSQGLEFALRLRPLARLDLVLSGIVNDARYTNYSHALCPPEINATFCDLTGQRVFNAPKQVLAFSGRYHWSWGALRPYASARYSYRGWTYGSVDNAQSARVPGYGLAALTLGAKRDTASGEWDGALWVSNAFNKLYYTRLVGGSTVSGYVGEPRTIGVTLSYAYR